MHYAYRETHTNARLYHTYVLHARQRECTQHATTKVDARVSFAQDMAFLGPRPPSLTTIATPRLNPPVACGQTACYRTRPPAQAAAELFHGGSTVFSARRGNDSDSAALNSALNSAKQPK